MAAPRLARATVPPPIVGDGTETGRRQEVELLVPGVAVERPAVAEDDRPPASPILEKDLCSVSRLEVSHRALSSTSGRSPVALGESTRRATEGAVSVRTRVGACCRG